MFKKKPSPSDSENRLAADQYCRKLIDGFEIKASHNKRESMICFSVSMGGSLLAPVFITLGADISESLNGFLPEFLFSKFIPAMLSVLAAASTAWLQLRKPQQLWALYRTSQRELEDALSKFHYKIGEYDGAANPDGVLALRISKIALDAHYSWLPMVPNPEGIQAPTSSTKVIGAA